MDININNSKLEVAFINGAKALFPVGFWNDFCFDGKLFKVTNGNNNVLVAPEQNVNYVIMKPEDEDEE